MSVLHHALSLKRKNVFPWVPLPFGGLIPSCFYHSVRTVNITVLTTCEILRDKIRDQWKIQSLCWMAWFKWQLLWMLRRHRGRSGMSHGEELELSDLVSHPSPMKQDVLMLFTLMMSYLLQEVPKGVLSSSLSITLCLHPLFIPATSIAQHPPESSLTSQTSSDSCLAPSTHLWPTSCPLPSLPSPASCTISLMTLTIKRNG